ncbi:MAG: glycosyltransferase family 2 protein [Clostridium perfringens]|nr:glycosyltransferase family 2 protein [Clostridium perfringens]
MSRKKLSVIVPMYYEEEVAYEFYNRLKSVVEKINFNYEIIFVNDGSKDNTLMILKSIANEDLNVRVIDFSRNFGHQVAVTAGILNCKGDLAVIIDADLQDPPELIVDMIEEWKKGFNVVYAKRKTRKGESKFKLVTAKYFYKILSNLADIEIPRDTGDFRLIDKKVIESFKKMPEKNRFIRGMISWVGFKQTFVEYNRDERFAGETKYPLKKMIKFATDGIISFSSKPLKVMSSLGILTLVVSFVILVYSIVSKLYGNTSSGWTSIMCVLVFFSGVQLVSLGIIGEYIARIYDESKNRPLYLINEIVNFEEEGELHENKNKPIEFI